MNKLIVEIEDSDLFKDLKVFCADNSMTLKAVMTQLIKNFLAGDRKLRTSSRT